MREISVNELRPVRIGQTENAAAGTGCTVFVCPGGMRAGLDVRGGGPASRESELLKPMAAAQEIHAIVLAGGSAFGLGAANGVMACLEERGIGFDVGVTKVPLAVQSDLFDLTVGDPTPSSARTPPWGTRRRGSRWTPPTTGTAITAPGAGPPSESSPGWRPA